MTTPSHELNCDSCGATYRLRRFRSSASYVCTRCGVLVSGDPAREDTDKTFLYAEPERTQSSLSSWDDPDLPEHDAGQPIQLGRYTILDEIGRGGMGVVYRALDEDLRREVAIKVLVAGRCADPSEVERFMREARSAARIDHPAVVRALDIGEHQGRVFFAMELVSGPSLEAVIREQAALPHAEAARIVGEVAQAVHAAHLLGLAHRDIKPANILLEADGTPLVTDFGLVFDASDVRLTQTGQRLGTPAYMSPEQARGDEDVDWHSVDVYALGAVLYETLTGRAPYSGIDALDVLMQILQRSPVRAASITTMPAELGLILDRAMARDPGERYASAAALADDLERFLAGQPVLAHPLSRRYRARLFLRRHRVMIRGALLAMLVLSLFAAAALGVGSLKLQMRGRSLESAATARLELLDTRIDDLTAAGRQLDAEVAFDAFVRAPENADTEALATAWLHEAHRRRARLDRDGEVQALARVYSGDGLPDQRGEALLGLVDVLHREGAWVRLEMALSTPEASEVRPQLLDIEARMAFALRDFDRALAVWEEADRLGVALPSAELAGVARTFTTATRLPHPPGSARVGELDGDDAEEVVLFGWQTNDLRVTSAGPDLPLRTQLHFPTYVRFVEPFGPEPAGFLVSCADIGTMVYSWNGGAPVEVAKLPTEHVALSFAQADTDGDGVDEMYVGTGPYSRSLLQLEQTDDGGFEVSRPAPTVDAVHSDYDRLVAADLDGDGRDEIIAAMGPWAAYDLRVLARDDQELVTVGRLKLGKMGDIAVLDSGARPLLAVTTQELYPNPKVFPPDRPYGFPGGLYLLEWTGQTFEVVASYPEPAPEGEEQWILWEIEVVDLDRDGLDDLVVGVESSKSDTLVYRQRPDGSYGRALMSETSLISAVDLDDDGSREILVSGPYNGTRELWALGSGSDRMDRVAPFVVELELPPTGASGQDLEAWRRAERLAGMGLVAAAAQAHSTLALRAGSPDTEAAALLRAGALWARADEPALARRDLELAAKRPQHTADALDLAVEVLLQTADLQTATEYNERILEREDLPADVKSRAVARRQWLRPYLDTPTTTLELGMGLDRRWELHRPVAFQNNLRRGTLQFDVQPGQGTVLSLPVRRTGEMVALELDLLVQRLEWDASFQVGLQGADQDCPLGLRMSAGGGGGILDRKLHVCPRELFEDSWRLADVSADHEQALTIRLAVYPALGETHLRVADTGGEVLFERWVTGSTPLEGDRWNLTLGGKPAGNANHTLASFEVSRIALTGLEPDLDAPQHTAVPGVLSGVLDATRRGDRVAAAEELRRALTIGANAETELRWALRTNPALLSVAREVLGAQFPEMFAEVWGIAVSMHPEDPAVHAVLSEGFAGLREWTPRNQAALASRERILLARARSRWEDGDAQGARDDALAVLDSVELLRGEGASAAHRLIALIALGTGRADEALAHARASVDSAAAPEIALDQLRHEEALAPLVDDPDWAPLLHP